MIGLQRILLLGLFLLGFVFAIGCEDRRYVEPAPASEPTISPDAPGDVDVDVNTPLGHVKVDGERAGSAAAPRDVKVNVGNGGAEVDVNGKPILERIRERRQEQKELPAATP